MFLVPGSAFSFPGSMFLVPGSAFSFPGSMFRVPQFRFFFSWFHVPGSRFRLFLLPGGASKASSSPEAGENPTTMMRNTIVFCGAARYH
jgi:hypothetical protein